MRDMDVSTLYELILREDVSYRWRYHGASPSPARFARELWDDVLVQFVIARRDATEHALGLVNAYNYDAINGVVWMSLLLDSATHRLGWGLEAAPIFLDYLFRNWPIRKVMFEMIEFDTLPLRSVVGDLLTEEVRYREHHYYDGAYHDAVVLALSRRSWDHFTETRPTLVERKAMA